MAIAVFDYAAWAARYPEFGGAVDESLAASLFAEAGLYLDNTDCSPVQDVNVRLMLLGMIVAHLASDSGALEEGGKPSGMVGRLSEAQEGSVRVKFDTGLTPGTAVWWSQTPYGMRYWAATKRWRTMRYIPGRQPSFEPRMSPWRR